MSSSLAYKTTTETDVTYKVAVALNDVAYRLMQDKTPGAWSWTMYMDGVNSPFCITIGPYMSDDIPFEHCLEVFCPEQATNSITVTENELSSFKINMKIMGEWLLSLSGEKVVWYNSDGEEVDVDSANPKLRYYVKKIETEKTTLHINMPKDVGNWLGRRDESALQVRNQTIFAIADPDAFDTGIQLGSFGPIGSPFRGMISGDSRIVVFEKPGEKKIEVRNEKEMLLIIDGLRELKQQYKYETVNQDRTYVPGEWCVL
jgi:hypothetical protein